MAALLSASLSLPFTNSTCLSIKTTFISPENITFKKVPLCNRKVSAGRKVFPIRAQLEAEVPAEESKKQVEGVVENKFTATNPYIVRCFSNEKITGDDVPNETRHIVFYTEGEIPYKESQNVGVFIRDYEVRWYSIASSVLGDYGDSKSLALCVKRQGDGGNFLCDLNRDDEVKMIGPVGTEMLMPKDPKATVIMLATGTGIAPFRAFWWKMFFEKHDNYNFNGLAWLFFGVPTRSSLLYKKELERMKETAPENCRQDFAFSREQPKMYIQDKMAEHGDEIWDLIKKDNTFVYMSGLKGMEQGIDDLMTSLAQKNGMNWADYKELLKMEQRWNVEVY